VALITLPSNESSNKMKLKKCQICGEKIGIGKEKFVQAKMVCFKCFARLRNGSKPIKYKRNSWFNKLVIQSVGAVDNG